MKTKDWAAFIGLSLAWGTSFLWIKIALDEFPPLTLVSFRLLFGLLGLIVVVLIKRPHWPQRFSEWTPLFVMGILNVAIPYALITWGEQHIDSAVAAILNSTVPLFTAIIAHFWIIEERLTWRRIGSVLLGFVGVVIILSRNFGGSLQMNLLGQGAVLLAAISYAIASTYARQTTRGGSPIVQSLVQVGFAGALTWSAAATFEAPITIAQLPISWVAVAWLGLIGACVAYLFYFYLIHSIGPTRTVMVTYTFPVMGLLLGWLFLNETLSWHLFVGGAMVVASVVVVNQK